MSFRRRLTLNWNLLRRKPATPPITSEWLGAFKLENELSDDALKRNQAKLRGSQAM